MVSQRTKAGEHQKEVNIRDDKLRVEQSEVTTLCNLTPTHSNQHQHDMHDKHRQDTQDKHQQDKHHHDMHNEQNKPQMHQQQCKPETNHLVRIENGGRQKGKQEDDHILLVRSGDIETNSGPTEEDNKCDTCLKKLRTGGKFLICQTCARKSHKQEKCSMTKKGQVSKDNWKCHGCRGDGGGQEQCRECGSKTRQGNKMLRCSECNETMHKQEECSRISRSRLTKINLGKWKCTICVNPER